MSSIDGQPSDSFLPELARCPSGSVPLRIAPLVIIGLILIVLSVMAATTL